MIKTVIFDIDNTLYSYDASHPHGMEAVLSYGEKVLGIPAGTLEAEIKRHQKDIAAELGKGNCAIHNRALRYQRICEERGLPLFHAARMNQTYWDALIGASSAEPGAEDAMKVLKSQGIRIGVGTDMTLDFQLEKLEHLGLMPYIDFVVSSEEAGAEKPDSRLFSLCIRKAGCAPEECLFIGDSLKKDVLGAIGSGMKALWYSREESPEAPSLSHFADLPNILFAL